MRHLHRAFRSTCKRKNARHNQTTTKIYSRFHLKSLTIQSLHHRNHIPCIFALPVAQNLRYRSVRAGCVSYLVSRLPASYCERKAKVFKRNRAFPEIAFRSNGNTAAIPAHGKFPRACGVRANLFYCNKKSLFCRYLFSLLNDNLPCPATFRRHPGSIFRPASIRIRSMGKDFCNKPVRNAASRVNCRKRHVQQPPLHGPCLPAKKSAVKDSPVTMHGADGGKRLFRHAAQDILIIAHLLREGKHCLLPAAYLFI